MKETDIQNAIVPNIEVPKSIDKACANLTDKPTKEIGNTMGDLWYLVFGGISERAEKKRLRIAKNIEDYKSELYSTADAIPEDRRQEPKLQIAGPALQKSQYCVEEKELREMFVKLISRSMDKSFNAKIRPSFSYIISQRTPLDAQNLKLFQGPKNKLLPLCEYKLVNSNNDFIIVDTNVFLQNPKVCLLICKKHMEMTFQLYGKPIKVLMIVLNKDPINSSPKTFFPCLILIKFRSSARLPAELLFLPSRILMDMNRAPIIFMLIFAYTVKAIA